MTRPQARVPPQLVPLGCQVATGFWATMGFLSHQWAAGPPPGCQATTRFLGHHQDTEPPSSCQATRRRTSVRSSRSSMSLRR